MKNIIALTFLVFSLAGCASRYDAVHATNEVTTHNKEVVTAFFNLFSEGDMENAFAIVDENVAWWVPGTLPFSGTKTKAEYLQIVGNIQQGFPEGLWLEVTSMIAEGDRVAVEVSSYGEHANGRTYNNKYHFLITLEDEKMIDVKEYMDTLHLYQLIQP